MCVATAAVYCCCCTFCVARHPLVAEQPNLLLCSAACSCSVPQAPAGSSQQKLEQNSQSSFNLDHWPDPRENREASAYTLILLWVRRPALLFLSEETAPAPYWTGKTTLGAPEARRAKRPSSSHQRGALGSSHPSKSGSAQENFFPIRIKRAMKVLQPCGSYGPHVAADRNSKLLQQLFVAKDCP